MNDRNGNAALSKLEHADRRRKQHVAWWVLDRLSARRSAGECLPGTPVSEGSPPGRIGVFSQWGIGDAVLATPLLSALRRRYPAASLELIGKPWLADLFAGTPWCDRTHVLAPPWTKYAGKYRVWDADWRRFAGELRKVRRERFDWLLGIRYDPREVLQIQLLSAGFKAAFGGGNCRGLDLDMGIPPHVRDDTHFSQDAVAAANQLTGECQEQRPVLPVSPEESGQAIERLRDAGYRGGPVVAVSWGAGHPIRRWDPSHFATVLGRLPQHVGIVVLVGEPGQGASPTPPGHLPWIRWEGSLSALRGLLSVTDLILAADSGVMHMASACGARVLAIFGPQRPIWFGPHDPNDRVVLVEPMPCRPCFDACIHDRPLCMIGITPDSVSRTLEEMLDTLETPRVETMFLSAN